MPAPTSPAACAWRYHHRWIVGGLMRRAPRRTRAPQLGATSQALGHSDLSTTAAIYGHYDLTDLERAMDALARARREREEPAD